MGVAGPRRAFPLVPRRTVVGAAFGSRRSTHRGRGTDVVGTRGYRPGDPVRAIDWSASARLSAARDADEFVVREFYAEEAPQVAIVLDRSPSMAVYEPPFPWLDKRRAALSAVEAIAASAAAARSGLGLVAESFVPPGAAAPAALARRARDLRWDAERGDLARGLATLAERRRSLPPGSFVFVVSDFLGPLPRLGANEWDVVAVVVQDPTWEQSFPRIGGVTIPFAQPRADDVTRIRVSAREARALAAAHEQRLARLRAGLARRGWSTVLVDRAEDAQVDRAFASWAERRRRSRRSAA